MLEKLINYISEGDYKSIKKIVSNNYEEVGEIVYNMCVGAPDLNEDTLNNIYVVISALIENGYNMDYTDINGNTALLAAVKSQIPELVFLFNPFGDLFNQANKDGITPIALSYTLEDATIKMFCTTKLKDHVNDIFPINGEDMTYFSLSIYTCSPAISRAIAINDEFDYDIHKPYLEDVEWDDSEEDEERKELIENIENGSFFAETEEEIVNNENKNLSYRTIVQDSIIYEKMISNDIDDIEDYLNETNVEYETAGFTPLLMAIVMENEELVNILLKYASVNHRTTSGLTPVQAASVKGNASILKKLIARGAYISAPYYDGTQPIFYAVANNYIEIVKILLENKIYIDEYNKNIILNKFNDNEHRECINLIKNYKNPQKPNYQFPFEENYDLGYDPTYETDGFHGVKYVLNTTIGSRMISTEFGANGAFGMPKLLENIELEEECVKVVSPFSLEVADADLQKQLLKALIEKMDLTEEEKEKLSDINEHEIPKYVGFLTADGRVKAFDVKTEEESPETIEWSNIKDLASTELNLVGLCQDGTIKVAESQYYEFYEDVLKWQNIVEIATGANIIYAIDKDNNLLFAGSDFAISQMGESYEKLEKIKKAKHINACGTYAIITDLDDKLITINCDDRIEYLTDIKQISCSYTNIVCLKNDGTLIAFGSNDVCACNVSKWHDIERVQSSPYSTIGYAQDGEILCTENMSSGICEWNPGFGNMTFMSIGSSGPKHNILNI